VTITFFICPLEALEENQALAFAGKSRQKRN